MPVSTVTTNVKEGSDNMKRTSFNYIICKNFSVCLELPTSTTYINILCIGGSRGGWVGGGVTEVAPPPF